MKVDDQFLVQKTAAVAAGEFHPELVPAVGDQFNRGGDPFEAFVVDELKEDDIVFEGIDAEDEVIADIADAEGKPAGLIDAAGDGFDADAYDSGGDIAFLGDGQGEVKIGPDIVQNFEIGVADHGFHHAGETGGKAAEIVGAILPQDILAGLQFRAASCPRRYKN